MTVNHEEALRIYQQLMAEITAGRHHELSREELAERLADFLLDFDAALRGGHPQVARVLGDLLAANAQRELGARRN